MWQSLDHNFDRYMETWTDAQEHRIWEKIPRDNPYGSKDEMLRQLAVGDEKEAQKRLKVQVLASKAKALQRHGGNRRSEDFQGSHANLENGDMPTRGANSDYLLALLQRDHPEILDTGVSRCDEGFCSFRLRKLNHCRLPKQTLGFS